jgi:hypothetical protein
MKASDKNNPFKTPENYFEEFSQHQKTKLNEAELKGQKETGFTLPEGYFEELNSNIQKKLVPEESKVISFNPYKKYYLVAASVAAFVILAVGLTRNTSPESTSWEDIANTDIENYFDSNDIGLTSYEIAEVIPVQDLELMDFFTSELNEDYIIDYLNEHTVDFEDLNLEEYE